MTTVILIIAGIGLIAAVVLAIALLVGTGSEAADPRTIVRPATATREFQTEVERFAGEVMFARAVVPHWGPVSKDGCRALRDCGAKALWVSDGRRFAYAGDRGMLPYGHAGRIETDRKDETALYWRSEEGDDICISACGYNHLTMAHAKAVTGDNKYVYDPDTGMRFRDFCTRPMSCINIHSLDQLKVDLDAVKDATFVGYGNHEQYFFRDYLAYQPEYMEKEMLCARTLKERGHKFVFMEELV